VFIPFFEYRRDICVVPVSNDLVNNKVRMSVHICEGTLHSNPSEKANILSKQFQSAFTSEANTNIPDKGPSTHPTMEPIKISRDGVYHVMDIGL
jgi:hypothetical protein